MQFEALPKDILNFKKDKKEENELDDHNHNQLEGLEDEDNLLNQMLDNKICHSLENKKVTVDFVNHSMGYAYTLGILEVVQPYIKLGKFLAIAPESGGLQGADWNQFEEVWQYGSNMGTPKGDVIYYQDGIAPQTPIKGIENLNPNKGGRVFIPKEWSRFKQGFLKSHHLNWFQWFFLIKPTDRGYFKR